MVREFDLYRLPCTKEMQHHKFGYWLRNHCISEIAVSFDVLLTDKALSTYLSGKLLQSSDVDGTFLRSKQVTRPHTKVRGRADHAAGKSKRIVRENGLSSAVVVLERRDDKHMLIKLVYSIAYTPKR